MRETGNLLVRQLYVKWNAFQSIIKHK